MEVQLRPLVAALEEVNGRLGKGGRVPNLGSLSEWAQVRTSGAMGGGAMSLGHLHYTCVSTGVHSCSYGTYPCKLLNCRLGSGVPQGHDFAPRVTGVNSGVWTPK